MQPDTGHLVDLKQFDEKTKEELEEDGYREVPDSHKRAAKKKLKGRKEAHVSLTSGGKLSRLCARWRKEKRARYVKKMGCTEINRRREKRRQKAKKS